MFKNGLTAFRQNGSSKSQRWTYKNAKAMRLGRMWEFTEEGKLSPAKLQEEAKDDIDKAGERLKDYARASK